MVTSTLTQANAHSYHSLGVFHRLSFCAEKELSSCDSAETQNNQSPGGILKDLCLFYVKYSKITAFK